MQYGDGDRMQDGLREVECRGYVRHQHEDALAERVQVSISDVQKVVPLIFDHLRQMYLTFRRLTSTIVDVPHR